MSYIEKMIEKEPTLVFIKDDIEKATNIIIECFKNGGKLLVCGNGGSASDSAHIVGELMKKFNKKRVLSNDFIDNLKNICNDKEYIDLYNQKLEQGLPCIDLTAFTSLNTAFINDTEPDLLYANNVLSLGKKEDVLLAISTSGNSKNIIHAANVAKAKNMKVIALTGMGGGKIKNIADISIISPQKETYLIQEDHICIYHSICLDIENTLF